MSMGLLLYVYSYMFNVSVYNLYWDRFTAHSMLALNSGQLYLNTVRYIRTYRHTSSIKKKLLYQMSIVLTQLDISNCTEELLSPPSGRKCHYTNISVLMLPQPLTSTTSRTPGCMFSVIKVSRLHSCSKN